MSERGQSQPRPERGPPVAPTGRPRWLRLFSFLMLLLAAHLGFQGFASLTADTQAPAEAAVVLSGAEARMRAFQLSTSLMYQADAVQVRLHGGTQLVIAAILLFAVAAIFTRDARGRQLAILSASLVGLYQVGHAIFSLTVERPALLVVMPKLIEQLQDTGELDAASAEKVKEGMELATVVGPIFFLAVGLALSIVMLVFFGGRRGRILYGVEKAPEQHS